MQMKTSTNIANKGNAYFVILFLFFIINTVCRNYYGSGIAAYGTFVTGIVWHMVLILVMTANEAPSAMINGISVITP